MKKSSAFLSSLAPASAALAVSMSACAAGQVLPVDRAGAGRTVLERRGELLEQQRQLGKFLVAGAHRRRALALVAGQAVEHVHGVVGAALLAVIDDVEAAFDLFADDDSRRLRARRLEFGAARARLLLFGQQQLHHFRGARQAAGVGGEDAVGRSVS